MIWNSLIRKKAARQNKAIISKEIIAAKKYYEIEVLEHSICAFIIKYLDIINNEDLKEPRTKKSKS